MLPTASHPEAQRAHHHIWASLILYLVSGPLLPFCSLQQVSQISFLKVILFIVTFGRSGSLLQTLLVFSLLVASRAYSSCRARASSCSSFSFCRAWVLGTWVSVVVGHGLSHPKSCGVFPDQLSNLCPLHWQEDSQPLYHREVGQISYMVSQDS